MLLALVNSHFKLHKLYVSHHIYSLYCHKSPNLSKTMIAVKWTQLICHLIIKMVKIYKNDKNIPIQFHLSCICYPMKHLVFWRDGGTWPGKLEMQYSFDCRLHCQVYYEQTSAYPHPTHHILQFLVQWLVPKSIFSQTSLAWEHFHIEYAKAR